MSGHIRMFCQAVWLFLLALVAGCVSFKKQTAVIRWDDKSPGQVTCLLVYEGLYVQRGLFAETADQSDLNQAKTQLARFAASNQELCLFGNWIGHVDFSRQKDETDENWAKKERLAKLIQIRNGAFLLNERQELSGYQTVTIPDVAKFAAELNSQLSAYVESATTYALAQPQPAKAGAKPADDEGFEFSLESLRLQQAFAKQGSPWVEVTRGKVVVTIPMTAADMVKLLDNEKTKKTLTALKQIFPAKLTRGEEALTLTFGDGTSNTIQLGGYRDEEFKLAFLEKELLEYARSLKVDFETQRDVKTLLAAFVGGQ